jgi:hypothetical protein
MKYIFGILTSKAINWSINELILRGQLVGGHLGGLGNLEGGLQDSPGLLPASNIIYVWVPKLEPV